MKNILSLLVIFLFSVSVSAQIPDYVKIRKNNLKLPKSSQSIKMKLDSTVMSMMEWEMKYKDEFLYNDDETVKESYVYMQEGESDEWLKETKSEFFYEDGRMIQMLNSEWIESESSWIFSEKLDYSYNNNGRLSEIMDWWWKNGNNDWENLYKMEFTYDDDGNLSQYLNFRWDDDNQEWFAKFKYEPEYEYGNRTQLLGFIWDRDQSTWFPLEKILYAHNGDGGVVQSKYYSWDEDSSQWTESWMEEYLYDGNRNIIQSFLWEEDEDSGQLVIIIKNNYTYDLSYSYYDLVLPQFENDISLLEAVDASYLFGHKLDGVTSQLYDSETEQWVEALHGDYYYSQHIVGSIEEIERESVSIFPNPVENAVNIKGLDLPSDVSIYNLVGQLVNSHSQVESTIDVSDLQPGVYFLHISVGDETVIKKILKK